MLRRFNGQTGMKEGYIFFLSAGGQKEYGKNSEEHGGSDPSLQEAMSLILSLLRRLCRHGNSARICTRRPVRRGSVVHVHARLIAAATVLPPPPPPLSTVCPCVYVCCLKSIECKHACARGEDTHTHSAMYTQTEPRFCSLYCRLYF